MEETITEKIKDKSNFELFKVIIMIGLIITMLVLAFVIWKYTQQMRLDPCNFCSSCKSFNNSFTLNLTQLKGGIS